MSLSAAAEKLLSIQMRIQTMTAQVKSAQSKFDMAGLAQNWVEMDNQREIMKNLVDSVCDAKMEAFRIVHQAEGGK